MGHRIPLRAFGGRQVLFADHRRPGRRVRRRKGCRDHPRHDARADQQRAGQHLRRGPGAPADAGRLGRAGPGPRPGPGP
ncbi:MAG TPA: hypothetical protein DEB06_07700, partial [Phycisphaerales bacterium]|nr:hypothetical protein [Phycisphaerales bacterium]